ncbi:unnamed protein product [Pedinophyceae sp. YPF-701]|nr:unnamed protein product [Pedinophyceae sp. YPF-701]
MSQQQQGQYSMGQGQRPGMTQQQYAYMMQRGMMSFAQPNYMAMAAAQRRPGGYPQGAYGHGAPGMQAQAQQRQAMLRPQGQYRPAAPTGGETARKKQGATPQKGRKRKRMAPQQEKKRPEAHLVAPYVPESKVLGEMVDLERQLDLVMEDRKALLYSLCDARTQHATSHHRRRMRIWVWSVPHNQRLAGAAGSGAGSPDVTSEAPSWSLYVYSRLLAAPVGATMSSEVEEARGVTKAIPVPPSAGPADESDDHVPLGSFFSKVAVKLEGECAGGPSEVVWERRNHVGEPPSSIEVKRRGSSRVKASVTLTPGGRPTRYALDKKLATFLGRTEGTRSEVLLGVWSYARSRRLHDVDKAEVRPDAALATALDIPKDSPLSLSALAAAIVDHLGDLPDITLTHTIETDTVAERGSDEPPPAVSVWDMWVDNPPPNTPNPAGADGPVARLRTRESELVAPGRRVNELLGRLAEHRRRRAMYLAFARTPVEIVNAMVLSQLADVRLVRDGSSQQAQLAQQQAIVAGLGAAAASALPGSREAAEYVVGFRSEVFAEKWAEEATLRYLQRTENAKRDASRAKEAAAKQKQAAEQERRTTRQNPNAGARGS